MTYTVTSLSYAILDYYSHDLYRDQFGGGIKIFVKDGVRFRIIDEYTFLNDLFKVLTTDFVLISKKYICSTIYHPPTSSYFNNITFVLSFLSFLRSVLYQSCTDYSLL